MSGPSSTDVLVGDPLGENTRKERRLLIGASAIGLIVVKAGIIPTKVSALGVDFSTSNQKALLYAMGVIVGYFLIAFVIYAASDYVVWRERFESLRRAESENYRSYKPFLPPRVVRGISLMRIWLEFVMPTLLGVYAIVVLFTADLPPTLPGALPSAVSGATR